MYVPNFSSVTATNKIIQNKPNNLQVAKLALERSKIKKLNNLEKAVIALQERDHKKIKIDENFFDQMTGSFEITPKNKDDGLKSELLAKLLKSQLIDNKIMRNQMITDKELKDYFLGQF